MNIIIKKSLKFALYYIFVKNKVFSSYLSFYAYLSRLLKGFMYKIIIIILAIFVISCNKDSAIELNNSADNQVVTSKKTDEDFTIKTKKIALHSKAKKVVEEWQEYQSVAEFIPKFYKTSTKEALINANLFYELTTYLKDSIRVDLFKTPSVKIRLNVLNNEALRLFDMDSIPNITNKEVIHETKNIVNAFNALNIKINNEVNKNLITKDLSGFNHLFEKEEDSLNIKPINIKNKQLKTNKRRKLLSKKRIKPLSFSKPVK